MRGHEQLIAMRRKGVRPASVTISDYPVHDWLVREWHVPVSPWHGVHATVDVHDDANLARLDLRFVVGLTVVVDTTRLDRMRSITAAVLAAGAKRVVSHCIEEDGTQHVCDTLEAEKCN